MSTPALDRVTAVSGDRNVKAFLHVIRQFESSNLDDDYTQLDGGEHFDAPPWVHPYAGQSAPPGKAAGAYKFIPHTWERCQVALGLDAFSPVDQDLAAVYLIDAAGALSDVQIGNIADAVARVAPTWISFRKHTLQEAERVFQQYGGTVGAAPAAPPVTVPTPAAPATSTQPESPMGFLSFLPLIMQFLPALAGKVPVLSAPPTGPVALPSGGSMHAADYMNLVATIVNAFAAGVPGASGPGHAIDIATSNPDAAATAAQAVMAQPDVVAQLNAMAPTLDKIASYDAATNAAVIAGRQSALVAQQANAGIVQMVVKNIAGQSWLMIVGVVGALIAAMVCKGIWPTVPDYVPMLIGPAGMIFGAVIKEMGAITSFYFDGTPASNATALARDVVEQDKAAKS